MDRRSFLKTLAAAGISTAIPLTAIAETLAKSPHRLKRRIQEVCDYGRMTGLSVNGVSQHGMLMHTATWEALRDDQKEEIWLRLEDAATKPKSIPLTPTVATN